MLIFMFMFFLVVSAQVDTFLREIFGSQANLEYAARSYFNTEDLRHSSAKIKEPWPKWEVIPSDLRHPVELLWWRLTRLLGESNRLPLTARRNGVALPRILHQPAATPQSVLTKIARLWFLVIAQHFLERCANTRLLSMRLTPRCAVVWQSARDVPRQAMDIISRRTTRVCI